MQNEEPDHAEDGDYPSLVGEVLAYEGTALFEDLLLPWIEANPEEIAWLAAFAGRKGAPIPPASTAELWRLYGLSRLCELLREVVYAPVTRTGPGPGLTEEHFYVFGERLGLDVSVAAVYSPFHHEVVRIAPARDPQQAPVLLAQEWPGIMLGELLIMRAGVIVEAGQNVLRPGVADAATLYWTYSRENRPTHDLAHGWGGNSAWRTPFRRDYAIGDAFHFNVDGKVDLAALDPRQCDHSGLTRDERIELLVNRSFVTTRKAHADLHPYDDRLSLPMQAATPAPGFWQRWKQGL